MVATVFAERFEVTTGNDRMLGEGGFGSVYKALDRAEDPAVPIAAKRVPLAKADDLASYEAEIGVLKEVHEHASIVSYLGDTTDQKGDGWLFLELATGGELFDRLIDSGSLSERAAWPYFSALVAAVGHCHAKGVVHRDLKLENVMLVAEDPHAIRLIDFGLAVQLRLTPEGGIDPSDTRSDCAGTEAYRAPEMHLGTAYDPTKTDVWALGIILFSLSSGFFPLREASNQDWRFKRLAKEQAMGESACDAIYKMYKRTCPFAPALKALVDDMLQIEPKARRSMEGVLDDEWVVKPPPARVAETLDDGDGPVYRGLETMLEDEDGFGEVVPLPEDAVPITRQRAQLRVDVDVSGEAEGAAAPP